MLLTLIILSVSKTNILRRFHFTNKFILRRLLWGRWLIPKGSRSKGLILNFNLRLFLICSSECCFLYWRNLSWLLSGLTHLLILLLWGLIALSILINFYLRYSFLVIVNSSSLLTATKSVIVLSWQLDKHFKLLFHVCIHFFKLVNMIKRLVLFLQ